MAFINGIGLISPQKTAEIHGFPAEITGYTADYLKCIEPVYRNYIDPIQARRMSRLIKMGITSAKLSLAEAECTMPDAIITGTGLGSVEDTEKILSEITLEEKFLNPTPFIQSTYNTISSQVAIQLKCHNYNSTYVHRTFSFESGLTDALMQFDEGMASNVLVGGIDEMTMNHLHITRRIGQWKMGPVHNLELLKHHTPGALPGEGAAFFLLGKEKTGSSYARLLEVKTSFNLNGSFKPEFILPCFLGKHDITVHDIDLVLLGVNGDGDNDPYYDRFANHFFPGKPQAWYKHLCGEYHTATGFGLYVASNMLRHQHYPEIFQYNAFNPSRLKNILIYNHFRNVNHSLMLVQGIF